MMTDTLISPNLVEAFMHGHYGYGNLAAPFWLIGMEEGGGGSVEEVELRMDTWQALGGTLTSDLAEYHRRLGMPEFFEDPVKLQHTWARLIRLLLAAQGNQVTSTTIKAYQRDRLGRSQDDTCLLELLPLPSPSTGVWQYGAWTGLPGLQRRSEYREACAPWRAGRLQQLIKTHCPQLVVFYGTTYQRYYELVTASPFQVDEHGLNRVENDETLCILVKHPAAWGSGASAAYFEETGRQIRRCC